MEMIWNSSLANILAIGTANPSNCYYQSDYPDFYFGVTKKQHFTQLKDKFKRICEKSMIKKRYMHVTEEFLKKNPSMTTYEAPSWDVRQQVLITEVPRLGQEAASKAIAEWGRPASDITHLIFCTSSGLDMPGADLELAKLLGLPPSVNRFMMYQNGCFAAGAALRLAKDVAENNAGARVLVVCSEITLCGFHEPIESHPDHLVGSALFGDGAAAVVVGAAPHAERPLFGMASARQTTIPNTEYGIVGHTREMGLSYYLSPEVPELVSGGVVERMRETLGPVGVSDWNSAFYVMHPGGPAVLDRIEERLGLAVDGLEASRHVLREYGNMWSPSVLFILDQMRKKSAEEGKATTGEGKEWGVLFAFGPGLTVETILLRSVSTPQLN